MAEHTRALSHHRKRDNIGDYCAPLLLNHAVRTSEHGHEMECSKLQRLVEKLIREGAARPEDGVQLLMNVLLARHVEYQRKSQSVSTPQVVELCGP